MGVFDDLGAFTNEGGAIGGWKSLAISSQIHTIKPLQKSAATTHSTECWPLTSKHRINMQEATSEVSSRRPEVKRANNFIDLTNRKFERLTAVRLGECQKNKSGRQIAKWHCECECGNLVMVYRGHLLNGHTRSCGCLLRDFAKINRLRHGHSRGAKRESTYNRWCTMKSRCSNPLNKSWGNYGGRGISVCDRWSGPSGYINFVSDMGNAPRGMSIDRIDNNGNYEPGNCQWTTMANQARNTRVNSLTMEKADHIRRLRQGGIGPLEISRIIGCSVSAVGGVIYKGGWIK